MYCAHISAHTLILYAHMHHMYMIMRASCTFDSRSGTFVRTLEERRMGMRLTERVRSIPGSTTTWNLHAHLLPPIMRVRLHWLPMGNELQQKSALSALRDMSAIHHHRLHRRLTSASSECSLLYVITLRRSNVHYIYACAFVDHVI